MRRLYPYAVILPALIALVAGCGSGSPGTGQANPAEAPPSKTNASVATAAPPTAVSQQSPVSAESNPPGDIKDNVAYVPYTNAVGHYTLTHPEGWDETAQTSTVLFTDKLNGLHVAPGSETVTPTAATAREKDVPALRSSQAAFELKSVQSVTEPAGAGVLIVYRRNSLPDPVTGRQYRDEVQRYELGSKSGELIVELFGPVGADNVDAYRTMIRSLRRS